MNKWDIVTLDYALKLRKEYVTIDDTENYKLCRVQWYGKGVILRKIVKGAEVKTKQQQICRTSDFVVAEIDAKEGGFGVVPAELDGAIVSSHYFLFEIDDKVLDKDFLSYFIRTPYFQKQIAAQGTTNYSAIRPHHVLNYQIPLPPRDEQQRIVAYIEAISTRISEAQTLRQKSIIEVEAMWFSALKRCRQSLLSSDNIVETLSNLTQITSGGTPSREVSLYWNGAIPWIKTGELLDNDIYGAEECITQEGLNNSSAKLFPPQTILIALYGQGQTRGRTGRLMIEAATNQACCAILPTADLEPRFLQYWLRSLYLEMREQSRGGAQPNWNSQVIKRIKIAVPSLNEQLNIVTYFDELYTHVNRLKQFQNETADELNLLLPSILDKAFKGDS